MIESFQHPIGDLNSIVLAWECKIFGKWVKLIDYTVMRHFPYLSADSDFTREDRGSEYNKPKQVQFDTRWASLGHPRANTKTSLKRCSMKMIFTPENTQCRYSN